MGIRRPDRLRPPPSGAVIKLFYTAPSAGSVGGPSASIPLIAAPDCEVFDAALVPRPDAEGGTLLRAVRPAFPCRGSGRGGAARDAGRRQRDCAQLSDRDGSRA